MKLTDTGRRVESRNAASSGSDALGQRALRTQFDGDLAGEILLLQGLVVAQVRQDAASDLARASQGG